jgi:hypothetical protein
MYGESDYATNEGHVQIPSTKTLFEDKLRRKDKITIETRSMHIHVIILDQITINSDI